MTKAEREERRELWRERVSEFRESGQSVAAWCRAHELKEHQMHYWLRRLSPVSATPEAATSWFSVAIEDRAQTLRGDGLLIHVGRATIEVQPGFNQALLADVVEALASPSPC